MAEFEVLKNISQQPDTQPENPQNIEISPQPTQNVPNSQTLDFSQATFYSPNEDERRGQLMERLKLKSKIIQYQETFPKHLQVYNYKMDKLDELSTEDLKIFLSEIKIAVSSRNSAGMTKNFYFGACHFIEKFACGVGYDIGGFKNILYQQEEVHNCLNELALEFEDNLYLPASVRLPYITLQCAMTIFQVKKTENTLNNELKKPIPEKLKEEYNDL